MSYKPDGHSFSTRLGSLIWLRNCNYSICQGHLCTIGPSSEFKIASNTEETMGIISSMKGINFKEVGH